MMIKIQKPKTKYDLFEIQRKLVSDEIPQAYVDWVVENYIKRGKEKEHEYIREHDKRIG